MGDDNTTRCWRERGGAGRADLFRIGDALAERVIERRRRGRARVVRIDLDQTDDPAHGEQQLGLFNRYYSEWCHLPLLCFPRVEHMACHGPALVRQRCLFLPEGIAADHRSHRSPLRSAPLLSECGQGRARDTTPGFLLE